MGVPREDLMRRVIVAVLAAVLLVPPIAVSAMADTTPGGSDTPLSIEITSARLAAKGVAVQLGVDLLCEPGAEVGDYLIEYGWGELRQAHGRSIVTAYGDLGYGFGRSVACDGQTITSIVMSMRPDAPMKPGSSWADITVCTAMADNYQSYGCATEQAVVRVTRK